ncbi:MAG: flagellar hook protein FlgE [Armatimonadetes bacterium]|nr:flagellar hook protein FlgE [Armatimonadota bacterium]
MLRSLLSGVSGLRNSQTALDAISNNIANVNTVGYKASRVTFQDLISQGIRGASAPSATQGGTNPMQVGLGMVTGAITPVHTQGVIQITNKSTDMAMEGSGFFIVNDAGTRKYTRDGSFDLDSNMNLISSSGSLTQGWQAVNGTINTGNPIGNLNLPLGTKTTSRTTSAVTFGGNLDASTAVNGTYAMAVRAYDSLGAGHDLTLNLTRTVLGLPANSTLVSGATMGAAIDPTQSILSQSAKFGTAPAANGTFNVTVGLNPPVAINWTNTDSLNDVMNRIRAQVSGMSATFNQATGLMTLTVVPQAAITIADALGNFGDFSNLRAADAPVFANNAATTSTWSYQVTSANASDSFTSGATGNLTFNSSGNLTNTPPALILNPSGGAVAGQSITLNMSAITQLGTQSDASAKSQDGVPAGVLTTFSIGRSGLITGFYANGLSESLGQIAVANFTNPAGLNKSGNNKFEETTNSGVAQIGTALTGGRGAIIGGSLEASNVDLSEEFTRLILSQRAFQASSRMVTASDDILTETVNLVRR